MTQLRHLTKFSFRIEYRRAYFDLRQYKIGGVVVLVIVVKFHQLETKKMPALARRNSLLPWFIGIVIIAIVDVYVGYSFYSSNCQAPGIAQFLVLVAMPAVYLTLMYLTFKSQE
jgi:hypothetical protein